MDWLSFCNKLPQNRPTQNVGCHATFINRAVFKMTGWFRQGDPPTPLALWSYSLQVAGVSSIVVGHVLSLFQLNYRTKAGPPAMPWGIALCFIRWAFGFICELLIKANRIFKLNMLKFYFLVYHRAKTTEWECRSMLRLKSHRHMEAITSLPRSGGQPWI